MHSVDLHVLHLPDSNQQWLDECLASIEGHPVNLFVVEGVVGHLGKSRLKAYALGEAPFVAHVDCDDILLPGAVRACLDEFEREPSWVCVHTNQRWMSAAGDVGRPWCIAEPSVPFRILAPHYYHFWIAKRACVTRALHGFGSLPTACDSFLQHRLGGMGEMGYVHTPYYLWRDHENGMGRRGPTRQEEEFMSNGWSVPCRG